MIYVILLALSLLLMWGLWNIAVWFACKWIRIEFPMLNMQQVYSLVTYSNKLYGVTYQHRHHPRDGRLFEWNVAPGRLFKWSDVDEWAEVAP